MQPFSSAYCWKGELKKKPPFWAGWLVGWPQCTAVMAVFLSVWSGRLRENSRMEEGCHHEDLFFSPVMLLCARVKSGRSRALTTLTSVMSALLGHVVRHACEEEGGRGGGMTGRCPKPAEVLLLLFPPMDVPSHCDSRELGFGIVKFDPAKTDGSQPPPVCVCVSVRFLRVHMGVGRVWSLRHQTLGRPYRRCRVYVVARLRCSEEVSRLLYFSCSSAGRKEKSRSQCSYLAMDLHIRDLGITGSFPRFLGCRSWLMSTWGQRASEASQCHYR